MTGILEFDQACDRQCPQECILVTYDTVSAVYERNGSLTVRVTYADLSYIDIGQTAKMNAFSLISEIGGSLGLFVGITFLSLLELLEYLYEIALLFL